MASWNRLTDWLRPKWQSREAPTRRRAAQELSPDDPQALEVLERLAQDEAAEVREAALKRLGDVALLRHHLLHDPAPAVRTAAGVRYRQMLIGTLSTDEAVAELEQCPDATVLAHVARKARQPHVRRTALRAMFEEHGAGTTGTALFIEATLHDEDLDVRLTALRCIPDTDGLERVIAQAAALGEQAGPDTEHVVTRAHERLGEIGEALTTEERPKAEARTEHGASPEMKPETEPGTEPGDPPGSVASPPHGKEQWEHWLSERPVDLHARRRAELHRLASEGTDRTTARAFRTFTVQALLAPAPAESLATRLLDAFRRGDPPPAEAGPNAASWADVLNPRRGIPLDGFHPDEATLRRAIHATGKPHFPKRSPRGAPLPDELTRLLERAEEAAAAGDLDAARGWIAEARALTAPAADERSSRQS